MADCSDIFRAFERKISLTPTDLKYLRSARSAVTKKIREHFSKNESYPKVKFIGQGSFTMGTIVKPIKGEFDIDIGVYLIGYSNWQSDWPKPETASSWIVKALENHTSTRPINKSSCVRVVYQPKSPEKDISYHVDLPIYIEYENLLDVKYTRIGINGDTQWGKKTDPVGLTKWFIKQCKENASDNKQLIRLVKYIKAWKENKNGSLKLPSGIALTVMMAENYSPNKRDDISFRETIKRSYNNLNGFFGINAITKPVENYNDLLEKLNNEEKKNFMSEFEKLVDDGKKAIDTDDSSTAISLWKPHFDNRFNQ